MGSAAAKPRPAMSRPQSVGATALAHDPQMDQELYVAPAVQELFIPEDKRLSLLQLSEDTCKWPIGDPLGDATRIENEAPSGAFFVLWGIVFTGHRAFGIWPAVLSDTAQLSGPTLGPRPTAPLV